MVHTEPMESYRPVARLATVVKLLLALNVVGSLGAMASSAAQIDLLNRIESGEDVYADAVRGDRRQALVGVSGVVLYLVTAVAFVAWFKRAYDNVELLDTREITARGGRSVLGSFPS